MDPRTLERLRHDMVIWLTTVSPHGMPQPRPVWFVWDGATVLIYSHARAHKLRHIASNASVSLNFNTNSEGYDVQVILGRAFLDESVPPVIQNAGYLRKFGAAIAELGMSVETYSRLFSKAVRVVPLRSRTLEPLPIEP